MWELYLRKLIFKNLPVWDLLGGPVVKNLPSKKRKEESAFQNRGHEKKKTKNRGHGSIPGWGTKTAHAKGQLSPHASNQRRPCAATKTQYSQK